MHNSVGYAYAQHHTAKMSSHIQSSLYLSSLNTMKFAQVMLQNQAPRPSRPEPTLCG